MEQSFDITFDPTFSGIAIIGGAATPECQKPGIYLGWLSPCGFSYWLFSGKATTETETRSFGFVRRAGLNVDTQKEQNEVITCRAGNLTKSEMKKIASLFLSVAVYVIVPNGKGKDLAIQVNIPSIVYPLWDENQRRGTIKFNVILPAQRSQLA